MRLVLHQTHHTLADFSQILSYLKKNFEKRDSKQDKVEETTLHLFPELFLTGYPLQDLCLQKPFITNYLKLLEQINNWSVKSFKCSKPTGILLGGLKYFPPGTTLATKPPLQNLQSLMRPIKNVVYLLEPGCELKEIYTKRLLPNYDIFDEKKYFTPGTQNLLWKWQGKVINITICEDMWPGLFHSFDPIKEVAEEIKKQGLTLDLAVNLSASPYNLNKEFQRIQRGVEISRLLQAPFAYVNRVGGEDEILFDGQSFVVSNNALLSKGKAFQADVISLEFPEFFIDSSKKYEEENSPWERIYSPSLVLSPTGKLPTLPQWSDAECARVVEAITFGLQEYAQKSSFKRFLVALSGGIDSALVLWLTKLSLKKGQSLEAIYMPSKYSSTMSYDLSYELCRQLNIPLSILPIKFLHSVSQRAFKDTFSSDLENLADENIQSRLRGLFLFARSNQTGAMVINTSNKSELAVGYSTLYGDSVGAISLLGDLYKTEVFQLANYLKRKSPQTFPNQILTRPPSAELRPNQLDEQGLLPYERLDAILECILSYQLERSEIEKMGFHPDEVKKVFHLYRNSEYKRKQFCPILKIKAKSFGFGHRVPISKNTNFYTNDCF